MTDYKSILLQMHQESFYCREENVFVLYHLRFNKECVEELLMEQVSLDSDELCGLFAL